MGKIRRYTCSAKNCRSVYSYAEGGVPMLTFPKDLHRCRVWVQNSGNALLLKQPKNKLHKLRYLCKAHFADNQFLNKYKTRLSKMAIPTIFSEPPLSDKQMEQFEVTDDDEVKLPLDQVFRSVTRHIDIPTATPLSHVVIEVSDLPGRVSRVRQTSMTQSVLPVLRTRDVYETEAIDAEAIEAEAIETEAIETEVIEAETINAEAVEAEVTDGMTDVEALEADAPSPLEVMDHTYATSGSSGDNVDCDVLIHGTDEEAVLPTVSSTPDPMQCGTKTVLQKLVSGDFNNTSINMELYKELIKMEKRVQDLQQEVDRLKATPKSQNSEVEPDLDLVHLIDVDLRGNRRKKVDESGCELNEELIALAIFRC